MKYYDYVHTYIDIIGLWYHQYNWYVVQQPTDIPCGPIGTRASDFTPQALKKS